MKENNKRVCKNLASSVTKSIGCIATEMTILGYIISSSETATCFLHTQVAILPCCSIALDTIIHLGLLIVCVLGWMCYGFKHKYVDKRLVNVWVLLTGDTVRYNFGSGQVDETHGDNIHIKLDRRIHRNYTVHVGVSKDNVRLVTLPRTDKKRLRNVIEEVLGHKHNE